MADTIDPRWADSLAEIRAMDHRTEAERCLWQLRECVDEPQEWLANVAARANVHALLAIADAIRPSVPASPVAMEGSEPAMPRG